MQKITLSTLMAGELDDATDSDVLSLISGFIDEIVMEIANSFKWQYLNTITELTLSNGSNTLEVDGVVNISSIQRKDIDQEILYESQEVLVSRGEDFENSGPPEYFFIRSFSQTNQSYLLQFNNISDDDYDLILKTEKEIDQLGDNDHIPFPVDVLPVIKHGIRSRWYRHEEKLEVSKDHESIYQRELSRFIEKHHSLDAETVYTSLNSDLYYGLRDEFDPNLRLDVRQIPSS